MDWQKGPMFLENNKLFSDFRFISQKKMIDRQDFKHLIAGLVIKFYQNMVAT